jgi:hypothetical protein
MYKANTIARPAQNPFRWASAVQHPTRPADDPLMWLGVGLELPLVAYVRLVACGGMSAQPVHEFDLDDPVEILRVLPARFHDQFLREYYGAAAGAARQVGGYRQLHNVLRLWRLTAAAHSDPGFAGRLAAVREAVRAGSLDGSVPVEEAVPGWPGRS